MINVLFAAHPDQWPEYQAPLEKAFADLGLNASLRPDFAPDTVDYIVYAPNSDLQDFRPYTRAKAVLNLWAGVEKIVGNTTLKIPLCRMVEPGLSEGMVEWVTSQVLRHHLGLDTYIRAEGRDWSPLYPPLARDRTIGILGLGELGTACATALTALNFNVIGWSRTPKTIAGVETFFGASGLAPVLARAEILIPLLPSTPHTESILNADTLAQLSKGAILINAGRGELIDDAALIEALDSGRIGHATLDVFRQEPLPPDHPFWAHPRVTITPHVASATRADTASVTIAENIRRGEAGEPFLHEVDRALAY